MRLLWIGKAAGSGAAGDEVYDRKIIAELERAGHCVERIAPVQVSRQRELRNMIRGVPYYRARYQSPDNLSRLREAARGYDAVICSWEPLDGLAFDLGVPVVPILHNVTSQSLVAMSPANPIARLLASGARAWERRAYGSGRFPAIAVLAEADAAQVRKVARGVPVIYAPPGLPLGPALVVDAAFRSEILISGTFDWRVKRRDILALATEWRELDAPLPVFADPMPVAAEAAFRPRPMADVDASVAIRLGVVPDRFSAGYKLKAGSYISANAVVVSFSDIYGDFAGLPDASLFVRHIKHARDIGPLAAEFAAMPADRLRQRFQAFRAAASERFSWTKSAARIAAALG